MKHSAKKYFFIALLSHFLLLAGAFFYFTDDVFIPENPFSTVQSYTHLAATDTQLTPKLLQKNPPPVEKKPQAETKNNLKSTQNERPIPAKNDAETNVKSLAKDSQDEQKILKILHEMIAQNQQYPESALAQQQKGTVKIGFLLHPNGNIESISLIHSSGFAPIDHAALEAVKQTSPIKAVGHLLDKPRFFSVDIIFE